MGYMIVTVLEETLARLWTEYQQARVKAEIAVASVEGARERIRAIAGLIEQESDGAYTRAKILEDGGLGDALEEVEESLGESDG